MAYKYVCKASCPELDFDNEPHCKCIDPDKCYVDYPDGCPCGNSPKWVLIEEADHGTD